MLSYACISLSVFVTSLRSPLIIAVLIIWINKNSWRMLKLNTKFPDHLRLTDMKDLTDLLPGKLKFLVQTIAQKN